MSHFIDENFFLRFEKRNKLQSGISKVFSSWRSPIKRLILLSNCDHFINENVFILKQIALTTSFTLTCITFKSFRLAESTRTT